MDVAGFILILILMRGLFGLLCLLIARRKGRSKVGWFFGGVLLELIAVIIVAVLPSLREDRERWEHADNEERRLREQVHQERMKNQALARHVAGRLDAHDGAMGTDSRAELPAGGAVSANSQPLGPLEDQVRQEHRWHVLIRGEEREPMRQGELLAALRQQPPWESFRWQVRRNEREVWRPAMEEPSLLDALEYGAQR